MHNMKIGALALAPKKGLSDENLDIPLNRIRLDNMLHFIEKPIEIIDHEVTPLKQGCILIVKVHWKPQRGPEFTQKRENQFKSKYLHLF
ncbi:hypothetical protein Tco_0413061 [Tanacetum coccineum]